MFAGLHCQFEETFENIVPYEHSFYNQLELYKKGMFQEIFRKCSTYKIYLWYMKPHIHSIKRRTHLKPHTNFTPLYPHACIIYMLHDQCKVIHTQTFPLTCTCYFAQRMYACTCLSFINMGMAKAPSIRDQSVL